MLNCREFDAFIVDYLDHEIPWSIQASIRWHQLLCRKCRAYLADYRRTIELGQSVFDDLESETPDSVPQELVKAVIERQKAKSGSRA
jgi:hypothetical protein